MDAFQQSSCEPDMCLIIMFDQERLMDDGYCHHNIYKMWEWHSSLCNSRVHYKMNKADITKYPHCLCLTLCNSGHSRKAGDVYLVLCVLVLDRAHREMRSPPGLWWMCVPLASPSICANWLRQHGAASPASWSH